LDARKGSAKWEGREGSGKWEGREGSGKWEGREGGKWDATSVPVTCCSLNPISPNIDHYLISPHSISALQHMKVMRIGEIITKDELF